MRRADAAEWLLLLSTTPERAAATTGDLIELGAIHGRFWFWRTLIRTTASFVWRTWSTEPLRMLWLAMGAWMLNSGLTLVFVAAIIVASGVGGAAVSVLGLPFNVDAIASFAAAGCVLLSQCLTGRWLARRAPQRELAACAAFLCADFIFCTSIAIALLSVSEPLLSPSDIVDTAAGGLFLFVGVHQIRDRRPAHTNGS